MRASTMYADVQVQTGVAGADSVRLIQMLFDGLLESFSIARGHIERKDIQGRSEAIDRANRIILGLQTALDFEKGGELAQNLNELYAYVLRRLMQVNLKNDLDVLSEVHGLMEDIAKAWSTLPQTTRNYTPHLRIVN